MSSENLKTDRRKIIQHESDFAKTNIGMQDRIKLDNVAGRLVSKEKEPKKADKKMIGPL